MFQAEQSLMTFEGQQMQGTVKIMEKVAALTFQKIARDITAIDCQPTFDGGILISVLGQLKVSWATASPRRTSATAGVGRTAAPCQSGTDSRACPAPGWRRRTAPRPSPTRPGPS